MKKFYIRLLACYKILFRKYDHWVILDVDKDNLVKLLKDEPFTSDVLYHGVQPYVFYKMIKNISNTTSEIDMICAKAEFEAAALEYKKNLTHSPKVK